MATWFAILVMVGVAALLFTCLIGLRYDRTHTGRESLLPSAADQERHVRTVRYHIDVQDSVSG